jgi:ABC-2 type transport system ATP-binding protein
VIFLDEPTIGLDMIAQKNIRDFLKYYNMQEKITIMLTSHYLEDIEALCQRTIVINNGSLVYDGKIDAISEEDIPLEESLEKLYRAR